MLSVSRARALEACISMAAPTWQRYMGLHAYMGTDMPPNRMQQKSEAPVGPGYSACIRTSVAGVALQNNHTHVAGHTLGHHKHTG